MPLRVIHILKATGVAGAENHLLTLLPELDPEQFHVEVVILVEPGLSIDEFAGELQSKGVQAQQVPIHANIDLGLIVRLWRIFRQLKPDILHSHLVHADFHGGVAGWLARVPLLVSSRHNDDPFRSVGITAFLIRLNNRIFHQFVAISKHMRRFSEEVERIDPDKIRTVHYGLEPSSAATIDLRADLRADLHGEFKLEPGPVLVCVARLVPQKGHIHLLRALVQVRGEVPAVRLVLLGDGTIRADLEQIVRDLALQANVCFAGWRTDAARLLGGADIFVLPSLWEGFGLVLLEAMAASLPIVASKVGAIPEIVADNETGLLVEPGAEEALSRALIKLLASPALRVQMGAQGCRRLEQEFSVSKMVEAIETIYNQLAVKEGLQI